MLYYLFAPLSDKWIGFNLFRYLSFRASMAAVLALLIGWVVGPFVIRLLKNTRSAKKFAPTARRRISQKKARRPWAV
ncbi:MAG: hypothetical protein U5R06_03520 [candidate division KSB1 bacterium]|nr:hypothetical protein [candidate division KSB1 bacterium]